MHLPGRAEPIRGKARYAKLVAASFLRWSAGSVVRAA